MLVIILGILLVTVFIVWYRLLSERTTKGVSIVGGLLMALFFLPAPWFVIILTIVWVGWFKVVTEPA